MIPCFDKDGMTQMIAWSMAEFIIGNFDAGIAAGKTKAAADPNYKPNPFADKHPVQVKQTDAEAFADYLADIRARRAEAARKS